METEKPARARLSMAAVNGIILGLIGFFVLLTPLTTEVPRHELAMDLVAGAALVIGGAVSILWGWLRPGQSSSFGTPTAPTPEDAGHPDSRAE